MCVYYDGRTQPLSQCGAPFTSNVFDMYAYALNKKLGCIHSNDTDENVGHSICIA